MFFLWVRGYVFLYEGPRSSGVGGYVFLGPLKGKIDFVGTQVVAH